MLTLLDSLLNSEVSDRTFQTARGTTLILGNPEDALLVLKDKSFVRNDLLRLAFGEGIVTSEDREGSPRRRLMAREYGPKLAQSFFEHSVEVVKEFTLQWRSVDQINLVTELHRMAMDIGLRATFGRPIGDNYDALAQAIDWGVTRIGELASLSVSDEVPLSPDFQAGLEQTRKTLDDYATELIHSAGDRGDGTLLSVILQSDLTEVEKRDEIVSLLLASSESSALTLSWAFVELASRPKLRAQLREEAITVLQGDFTMQAVANLVLTGRVIEETLRLYPPVWHMVRLATRDVELSEGVVKKGTNVVVSPYLLQRDEQSWTKANVFDPARFDSECPKSKGYLPFSQGHHICLGKKPALIETTIVLALLHRDVRIELLQTWSEPKAAATLRHRTPLAAKVEILS